MTEQGVLLFGNGSHGNLGCQAIDIGTAVGLAEVGFLGATFAPMNEPFDGALIAEASGLDVTYEPALLSVSRSLATRVVRRLARSLPPSVRPALVGSRLGGLISPRDYVCALALGGDNYSLDYGPPDVFFALNRAVSRGGVPLVMWGASIGPFDSYPAYERMAARELRSCRRIFVREDVTAEYVRKLGLEALVSRVSDPAFLMKPEAPVDADWAERLDGAIGLNVSPLIGAKLGLERAAWTSQCVALAEGIVRSTGRDVGLVAHVEVPGSDDRKLLEGVQSQLSPELARRVLLVPPGLNARQLKWAIGRFAVFVGARTHATIAAMSQGVPTVSLGYSAKSVGVNMDTYGDTRWVVGLDTFSVDGVCERVARALEEAPDLTTTLLARMPEVRSRSRMAFAELATLSRETGGASACPR